MRYETDWNQSGAWLFGRVHVQKVFASLKFLAGAWTMVSLFSLPLALAQEYVPGEVIVKLKGKSKAMESQAFIGKAVSEKAMTLKGSFGGLNMHHFSLKPGQNLEAAIAELNKDPSVEYAEPNYIVEQQSAGFEGGAMKMSDVREMAISDVSAFSQTNAPIQLQDGWSAATDGLNASVVAVIDTGLDLSHSVFVDSGAIWTNPGEIPDNGIDDDGNGYVDDVHGWNFVDNSNAPQDDDGHGTHVSGIILGVTQDISVQPLQAAKIRIMPLKFLDGSGQGTTSAAIKAIYYAVNNGAKVLNNSWGGGGASRALLDAIIYAYDKKTIFVAAAGNAANNNDQSPTYPASYSVPNVVAIAATSDYDSLAGFSNYGATSVHMGSPGVSIYSTLPDDMYGRASGTSMAAPFVSGVAALVVREAPEMTGYQAKSLIFSGAVEISSLSSKTITHSRLNVYNAVQSAKGVTIDPNQPAFDASSAYARTPAAESVSSDEGAGVGGCGLVAKGVFDAARGNGSGGPPKSIAFFALLVLLMAPVVISVSLRNRDPKSRRRHERFHIDSQVKLRFGDRELVGNVSTISLGGVQLNTDAWLDNGGVVKMSIRSPDGSQEIEVEGKVVWSEEKKRYGVAFAKAEDGALAAIKGWTQSLTKA